MRSAERVRAAAVRVVGVTRRFPAPGGEVDALVDVDLEADAGSLTVVTGASGSGKSTLLGLLAATDRPDAGWVEIDSRRITSMSRRERRAWRRDQLGFVVAAPADNLTDRYDAAGNVAWAASLRRRPVDRAQIAALLTAVDLGDLVDEPRGRGRRQLSGGEQQRLAFACALAGDPALVVADEPTASLDAANADAVVAIVCRLVDRGTTIVVASHDPRFGPAADTLVRLEHGRRVA